MRLAVLIVALLCSGSLLAWDCRYEKDIDQTLDLSGSEMLTIKAAAGSLEVSGVEGSGEAVIRGRVCVSKEEWLDESSVELDGGRQAEISVVLPDASGWSLTGNSYASIDLEIDVPAGISLDIRDSSGDMEVRDLGTVRIKDSSGDIEIENIAQSVTLSDSSGDIDLEDIQGDVIVENDSSGHIRGEAIEGSVRIIRDSSGDIRFSDVGQDFTVERDSSGDIVVSKVGGDFTVGRDGSGDIQASNVNGAVITPGG